MGDDYCCEASRNFVATSTQRNVAESSQSCFCAALRNAPEAEIIVWRRYSSCFRTRCRSHLPRAFLRLLLLSSPRHRRRHRRHRRRRRRRRIHGTIAARSNTFTHCSSCPQRRRSKASTISDDPHHHHHQLNLLLANRTPSIFLLITHRQEEPMTDSSRQLAALRLRELADAIARFEKDFGFETNVAEAKPAPISRRAAAAEKLRELAQQSAPEHEQEEEDYLPLDRQRAQRAKSTLNQLRAKQQHPSKTVARVKQDLERAKELRRRLDLMRTTTGSTHSARLFEHKYNVVSDPTAETTSSMLKHIRVFSLRVRQQLTCIQARKSSSPGPENAP